MTILSGATVPRRDESNDQSPAAYLEKLNEAQRKAVVFGCADDADRDRPLLVIAGAGSGLPCIGTSGTGHDACSK